MNRRNLHRALDRVLDAAAEPKEVRDNNGNVVTVARWGSLAKAQRILASNKGCKNCVNCEDCTNCTNCRNCAGCKNCVSCEFCGGCTDCNSCTRCSYCKGCVNCWQCTNGVSEKDEKGLTNRMRDAAPEPKEVRDSNGNVCTVGFWGSLAKAQAALASNKNCKSCWNCKNCTNCADCLQCADCTNCVNCGMCENCRDCKDIMLNHDQTGKRGSATDAAEPKVVRDSNGNDCHVEFWGSLDKAKAALASNKNCRNCRNCEKCTNCKNCNYCANCTDCDTCWDSENCKNCIGVMNGKGRSNYDAYHKRTLG